MTDTPVVLIVFLALGTVAVVLALLLVRSRQELSRSQLQVEAAGAQLERASRHAADLGARLRAAEAELRHLVESRIPDLATSLAHSHVPVPGPLGTATLSPELDRSIDAVLVQVREEVAKERIRVDAAAQAAMRGATTTIQALLYQLQTLLQRMQEKYEDPLVAEDLLAADFLNEQALRRIQSTAVVCGAWPGLTRENSHLADIVVGASSRLSGYERVQVTNLLRDPVGVIARAVEPVAVTLTELMANALHHSHPELPVTVTLQQGNRGASVIIDDAGVGMHTEELARAKRLMSGDEALLVTELGDPPRNGFAAVGRLVRQYGFSAHVEASPYGGVRAIVHIPGDPLLTLLDEAEHPMSVMAPSQPHSLPVLPGRPATDARTPSTTAPTAAPATATTTGAELPRRRRRRPAYAEEERNAAYGGGTDGGGTEAADAGATGGTGASVKSAGGTGAEESGVSELSPGSRTGTGPAPPSTPEESAERWSAFQKGTASGRAAAGTYAPGTADTADASDRSATAGTAATKATAGNTDSSADTNETDGAGDAGDPGSGASEGDQPT
ncbi:ATP-binding protein [Streptomyces sp. WMMB 322]|uniref:ATP-binding protein n=1 Tax=Streptomyces sp. WMMB 322 TaxID=1286821 RepID=UPI000823CD52|nr:ATP-binding protein [Streptomyces sp. WMMB 322]SCK07914.1 Signal transduction histidine kinase [Streptomyces sp. WMMB 322]